MHVVSSTLINNARSAGYLLENLDTYCLQEVPQLHVVTNNADSISPAARQAKDVELFDSSVC